MEKQEKSLVKLYKCTMYILDWGNRFKDFEEIENELDKIRDVTFIPFGSQSAPILWHDDIDINCDANKKEDYEKYFNVNELIIEEIEARLGYKIKIKENR